MATAREHIKDPTQWELPENIGQYRDDRRNVFLDGKSNLVIKAAKDGPTFYGGKIQSRWRGGVGHTWEARIKLDCLTAGAWPAYWLGNDDQGEIDIVEWYGNGSWPSATTVHAKANGGEMEDPERRGRQRLAHLAVPVGRERHAVLEGLRRRRRTLLLGFGGLAAGLAVQRSRLHRLPGVQPRGRRLGRRRPGTGQLPGADAGRLDSGLVGAQTQMTG